MYENITYVSVFIAGLLGGVPMFAFPLHQEQEACSRRLAEAGLGAAMLRQKPEKIRPSLEKLLEDPAHKQSSQTVAARYQGFDYRDSVARMVTEIGEALP